MTGIKRDIKFSYPTPIATAYGRACSAEERAERTKRFRELFEIAIRYAALSGCARVFAGGTADIRADALSALAQEKLSLGHWVGIVGALDRILSERGEFVLGTDLREQRTDLENCIAFLKAVDGYTGSKISLATVFDRLKKLRNKEAHRVGFSLSTNVELYRGALEELLERTAVWQRWQLLLVLGTEHRRSGTSAKCHAFRGDTTHELMTVTLGEDQTLYNDALYLHDPDTGRWIELSPFLLHKNGKLYFFDGIDRKRRPVYSLEGDQLDPRTLDEAEQHLRERVGFLFAQPQAEPSLDALAPFVQMAAADGVITQPELRFLRGRVEQLAVGLTDEAIDDVVSEAIGRFAPDARVERGDSVQAAAPPAPRELASPIEVPPADPTSPEPQPIPSSETPDQFPAPESDERDPAEQVLEFIDSQPLPTKKSEICAALKLDRSEMAPVVRRLLKMNEVLRIGRRGPNVRIGRPGPVLLQVLAESEYPLGANDILELLELDYYRWRRLAAELLESGEIVAEGAGRGRKYRLPSDEPSLAQPAPGAPALLAREPEPPLHDWTGPATEFLRAAAAEVLELGLPFQPTATTDEEHIDEIVDRWLTYRWSLSETHYVFVSAGRKYDDRLSVAWGFASEHARRDPVFRAVVADLGAAHPGAEVEIEDSSYIYAPEDSLCLISGERVRLGELGESVAKAAANRVVQVAHAVCPLVEKHLERGTQDRGQEEVQASWTELARTFLAAVRQAIELPFDPHSTTTEEELAEVEDGWMRSEWNTSDRHGFYVAVGRKWGWKISVATGFGSAHVRRDPEFRQTCGALGLYAKGSTIEVGELAYVFCPEDALALENENRIRTVDLADAHVIEQTVRAVQELMSAVLDATMQSEGAIEPPSAAEALETPAIAPPSTNLPAEGTATASTDEAEDWTRTAASFLQSLVAEGKETALPFPAADVSDPLDDDAIQGRWVSVQWQISPKHHMFASVGRKYGDRITVAWGFGSFCVRRDPEFRAIVADWGFHDYGERQTLAGDSYEFTSEAGLQLVAHRRTSISALDSSAERTALLDKLRSFGSWAWPQLEARWKTPNAPGPPPSSEP